MGRFEPPPVAPNEATGGAFADQSGRQIEAKVSSEPSTRELAVDLAELREEAWRNLRTVEAYARCARYHLELEDDGATIWDLKAMRDHVVAVLRIFQPVRRAFRERIGVPEPGE